jgi:diguanylate cyclase (GGDEF)-like protein
VVSLRVISRAAAATRSRGLRLRVGIQILLAMATLGGLVLWRSGAELGSAYRSSGQHEAAAIARTLTLRSADLDEKGLPDRLDALRERNRAVTRVDIFAIDKGGPVKVASTDTSTLGDAADRRDVAPIRSGRSSFRDVHQHQRHLQQLSFALVEHGKRFAAAAIYTDLAPLDHAMARSRRQILGLTLGVGFLVMLTLILLLRRSVFGPLDRMAQASRLIADGELATRLNWRRRDELGAIAVEFDAMTSRLERTHERLQGLALSDPLTGLANHRAFQERLAEELQRARREGYEVCVAALDIDYFKGVNDSFGHAVGDEALRMVAHALHANTRPGDICGRIGGDEFMVGLVRADAEAGADVMRRVCDTVCTMGFGPDLAHITVSVGLSVFPGDSEAQDTLMASADEALYRAKHAGRDRIAVCSSGAANDPATPGTIGLTAAKAPLVNTLHALARAVDAKDGYTHQHSRRVAAYARTVAGEMDFGERALQLIGSAGVLHDVGKLGIADAILLKPSALTAEEFEEMKRHSVLGADIVAGAGMAEVATWVRHLHERWDGGGYPDGIAGEEIPLESRILAVVDALEAMTSTRVYRKAMPVEVAIAELERGAGTQFDARIALLVVRLLREGVIEVTGGGEALVRLAA